MLGCKGELEAAIGLGGEPCFRLLGDVCGMVVKDQLDGGIRRIGGVDVVRLHKTFADNVGNGRWCGRGCGRLRN